MWHGKKRTGTFGKTVLWSLLIRLDEKLFLKLDARIRSFSYRLPMLRCFCWSHKTYFPLRCAKPPVSDKIDGRFPFSQATKSCIRTLYYLCRKTLKVENDYLRYYKYREGNSTSISRVWRYLDIRLIIGHFLKGLPFVVEWVFSTVVRMKRDERRPPSVTRMLQHIQLSSARVLSLSFQPSNCFLVGGC